MRKRIGHFIFLLGLVFLDQYSKLLAAQYLKGKNSIELIKDFFYLTYAENSGAAWSILQGQTVFFIIAGVTATVCFIVWYFKTSRSLSQFAIVMIIAGTLGNLTDRLLMGDVRDFLNFFIFNYDFPIFNFADAFLTLGMIFMIVDIILEENYDSRKNNNK